MRFFFILTPFSILSKQGFILGIKLSPPVPQAIQKPLHAAAFQISKDRAPGLGKDERLQVDHIVVGSGLLIQPDRSDSVQQLQPIRLCGPASAVLVKPVRLINKTAVITEDTGKALTNTLGSSKKDLARSLRS